MLFKKPSSQETNSCNKTLVIKGPYWSLKFNTQIKRNDTLKNPKDQKDIIDKNIIEECKYTK